jgi:alkylresorcinol/alkylpyrone synthase
MGSDVEDPGLAVVFDRAIPPVIDEQLAEAVDGMCAELGTSRDEIDRFCCHPGGVKVIDAIESALELNQGELNLEREVLRQRRTAASYDVPWAVYLNQSAVAPLYRA